jgi:hypothetical protein
MTCLGCRSPITPLCPACRRRPHITVQWDQDYWFWEAVNDGKTEAFGGTDREPDPSVKPDEDDMRRVAGELGASVEWDSPVVWL